MKVESVFVDGGGVEWVIPFDESLESQVSVSTDSRPCNGQKLGC